MADPSGSIVAGVVGAGATGARAARQLAASPEVARVVLYDPQASAARSAAESLGERASVAAGVENLLARCDVVVIAAPGPQLDLAVAAVGHGAHVVSTSTSAELFQADAAARAASRSVVVGAGFCPGFSDLVLASLAQRLETVSEVEVASLGGGGVACSEERAGARRGAAQRWSGGAFVTVKERTPLDRWFPPPIGMKLCVPSAGAVVPLAVEAFAGLKRASYLVAAGQGARLVDAGMGIAESRLAKPLDVAMAVARAGRRLVARPSAEDEIGAFAIEVTGTTSGRSEVLLAGAIDRPAVAAGTVAAAVAVRACTAGMGAPGAHGVTWERGGVAPLMAELWSRGVRAAVFGADGRAEPLRPADGSDGLADQADTGRRG